MYDPTILDNFERVNGMNKGCGLKVTTAEICEFLGVSERTIQTWIKTKGMPVAKKGGKGKPSLFWSKEVLFWHECIRLEEKLGEIPDSFLLEWERNHLLKLLDEQQKHTS